MEDGQKQIFHRPIVILDGKHLLQTYPFNTITTTSYIVTSDYIFRVVFFQLFYLDRVEFKAQKVDRWFPTAINWPTEKVKQRDRDEQLPGEYGRGRIIERLDYKTLKDIAQLDLHHYLTEMHAEDQHAEPREFTPTVAAKDPQCPYCQHCKDKLQVIIPDLNEHTEVNLLT